MSVHGGDRTVYFFHGGTLFGCGGNDHRQIGVGDKEDRLTPVEIKIPSNPAILKFKSSIGSVTTVVLTSKGLYGCGHNARGQLGRSDISYRRRMKKIDFYKDREVVEYYCEGSALWVVLKRQRIYRSGSNSTGALAFGTPGDPYWMYTSGSILVPEELDKRFLSTDNERVIDIKGLEHTIILTDKGRVYTCGDGKNGKRGIVAKKERKVALRSQYSNLSEVSLRFEQIKLFEEKKEKVVQIALGSHHSLFLTTSNFVYSCGKGDCGTGQNGQTRNIPNLIGSLKKEQIEKLRCGGSFSLFLSRQNYVFACGRNDSCQTAIPGLGKIFGDILVPTKISTHLQIAGIAATWDSSIFLASSGQVYCAGCNDCGQCCLGKMESPIKYLTRTKIKLKMPFGGWDSCFRRKPITFADLVVVVVSS